MTWYLGSAAVERYLGGLAHAAVASVETRATGCAACRSRLADDPSRLASSWTTALTYTLPPTPGPIEPALRHCGVSSHLARVIVVPWLPGEGGCSQPRSLSSSRCSRHGWTRGALSLAMTGLTTVAGGALLAFGATGQGGHLVVLLLAILVLANRSRAFDLGVVL